MDGSKSRVTMWRQGNSSEHVEGVQKGTQSLKSMRTQCGPILQINISSLSIDDL